MNPGFHILSVAALVFSSFQAPALILADLNRLVSNNWTGTLTYLDYSSKQTVTLKCNLVVKAVSGTKGAWTFDLSYPEEPKANGTEKVALSADGKTFDGEAVINMSKGDGKLTFTTEMKGSDDKRPAVIRHVYELTKDSFTRVKKVKFQGDQEFFERNRFSWKR